MKSQILLYNLNVKKRNFSRDEENFHNFLSFDTWISTDFKTFRQTLKRARFRGSLLPSQVHCTDYCSIFGRPAQVWPPLAGRRGGVVEHKNKTDPQMALLHQHYFLKLCPIFDGSALCLVAKCNYFLNDTLSVNDLQCDHHLHFFSNHKLMDSLDTYIVCTNK